MKSLPFRAPELPTLALKLDRTSLSENFSEGNPASAKSLPPTLVPEPLLGLDDPLPLWKRFIDLVGCALALPFLGLCAVFMLLLIKRYSPGPVFFRQERVGYMGRRFKIYKFRTMRVGADCHIHQNHCQNLIRTNAPMVKLDSHGDSRLIPFAWLIRACGWDELPQIINVLRGEMSLVGPRPCLPAEFDQLISRQRQRCDTLPGLTGLWQVSGKNRTTFEQMIRLDLRYARELSLWMDLKIIFLTIPALIVQFRETRQTRKAVRRAKLQDSPNRPSHQDPAPSGTVAVAKPA